MNDRASKESEVAREIAGLDELDRENLIARWRAAYGAQPPRKLSRALMEKALAYEIQCRAFGGLSGAAKRALRAAAASKDGSTGPRSLNPGARLIREELLLESYSEAARFVHGSDVYGKDQRFGVGNRRFPNVVDGFALPDLSYGYVFELTGQIDS